ncbi:MAG: hypothetical protein JKY52_10035 [Flavobacteriales bacterium]|nr:hypothetical protein [Flavobacteriales bacterium]
MTFIINGRLSNCRKISARILAVTVEETKTSVLLTKSSLDAIDMAEQAIMDGANYVIAVGGDGMVNEVVNGYMRVPEELRCKVALGVYSAGKGNDYVKSLGTSGALNALFQLIRDDSTKAVDVGLVTCVGLDGKELKRYFINIMDVGLAGFVVQNIDLRGTFINGFLTYQKAILQTFFTYKHIEVRLESEEFTWEGPILSLILGKGRFFGSGMCIAPHAKLDDGKLGLVLIGNVSLWDYFRNLGKIKKGKPLDHPEVSYRIIGDCKITPINGECPIDMDGEFVGYAPLMVKVIPGVVRFLAS